MNKKRVLTTSKEVQVRIWEEYYKVLFSATDRKTQRKWPTHTVEYICNKFTKANNADSIQPELLKVHHSYCNPLIELFRSDEVLPPQSVRTNCRLKLERNHSSEHD